MDLPKGKVSLALKEKIIRLIPQKPNLAADYIKTIDPLLMSLL